MGYEAFSSANEVISPADGSCDANAIVRTNCPAMVVMGWKLSIRSCVWVGAFVEDKEREREREREREK